VALQQQKRQSNTSFKLLPTSAVLALLLLLAAILVGSLGLERTLGPAGTLLQSWQKPSAAMEPSQLPAQNSVTATTVTLASQPQIMEVNGQQRSAAVSDGFQKGVKHLNRQVHAVSEQLDDWGSSLVRKGVELVENATNSVHAKGGIAAQAQNASSEVCRHQTACIVHLITCFI
jgi:hypothetical protein